MSARAYYATCPSGLERLAATVARKEIRGFSLKRLFSGALLFTSDGAPESPCFQNVYLPLATYERVSALSRAAELAAGDRAMHERLNAALRREGFSTFRVMFSDRNALASADPRARAALERAAWAARVDRERPKTELMILTRSEGCALALLRLTMGRAEKPERGELGLPLAHAMVMLARPTPEGAFLDPFAGHGALGKARLAAGPVRAVYMSDADKGAVARLKGVRGAKAMLLDAMKLSSVFPRGAISELVTDPPWGLFAPLPAPAEQFYPALKEQLDFVCAPDARKVALTADKANFERYFAPSERYDLLVSGKKAALYLI